MEQLPAALAGLANYRQFILWKAVQEADKTNKYPVNPIDGSVCNAHDPASWVDIDAAQQYSKQHGYGIGFVFTEHDPFFFIDIDKCLQGNNTWTPLALSLCQQFTGCAVEVSQSGRGLHIIGMAAPTPHGCKNVKLGLECYTEGRFVALTGTNAIGDVNTNATSAFEQAVATYFPPADISDDAEWTSEPVEEWSGPEDDDQLIDRILNSKASAGSVFGGKASVQDLWHANAEVLSTVYPDDQGLRAFDNSSADAALCQHLAFWTGKNCDRMDRLFRRSGLYRDKWENRPDYRQRTILRAVGLCQAVFGSQKQDKPEHIPVDPQPITRATIEPEMRSGFQYLQITQQVELFKGCVYVRDVHRVYVPDGGLLKPEQFKAVYGGYVFALDAINDKITKNAWEAFTESQAARFPRVHRTCFRPELEPGGIIEEEGHILVNTYVPINTRRVKGDPAPFLDFLPRLLPNVHDREILLAYMAACIQYPGKKFQWTPLLQGVEGNGKTIIISIMAAAIGHRYTHLPNAQDLGGNGSKFNAWLQNKLFIGVEEVYVSDRREALDALKPLITNSRIEVQGKGADQITGDNRANFIMCSNHKDAVLKTRHDRRYCVFYTAQQDVEDLARDGMDGTYFPNLYDWLKGDGIYRELGYGYGYAVVADYLANYPIPNALNPATVCHRAPITSSTTEAIGVSLGGIEQEILEAIDERRPGFADGWISSMALDRLLQTRRDNKRITHQKRRELLKGLGYELHPNLNDGRVNSVVMQEGGKPRLYIRKGHVAANLKTGAEILKVYTKAQGYEGGAVGESGEIINR